jgi:type IV pilus assembly protein PilA
MRRHLRNERGVTLVELMVVVAIIAIIAAIAITLYQDVQKKAKLAADQGQAAALRSAVAIYYGKNNGVFPSARSSVNTLVVPTPAFQCSNTPVYDTSNGKITHAATIGDCP